MFYKLIFICQLFLTMNKAVSTKQISSVPTTLKHEIGICGFSAEFCEHSSYHINSLSSWIVRNEWMKECVKYFTDSTCGKAGVNVHNDIVVHRSNSPPFYLLLSLEGIEDMLAAIQSFRDTSKYFLEFIKCANGNKTYKNTLYSDKDCSDPEYLTMVEETSNHLGEVYSDTMGVYTFQKYFEVIISLIVIILGLVMDGTLLFILIKHRKMLDEAYVIIFNIAVCDFIALVVIFPVQYMMFNGLYYSDDLILTYAISMILVSSANALSIFSLSIQRLMVITGCLQGACCSKINKYLRIVIFILFVYGPSTFIIVFLSIAGLVGYMSKLQIMIWIGLVLVFFFLILPITVTVINVVTSRKLRRSAKEIPGESIRQDCVDARYRSSRVITFLCIIFWFTHAPVLFVSLFLLLVVDAGNESFIKLKYLSFVIHSLFYLNAFLNPLAQVIISKHIRELYKKYLLKR